MRSWRQIRFLAVRGDSTLKHIRIAENPIITMSEERVNPRHECASSAVLIDGLEVYRDGETGLWVAAHPGCPVSSCGDTKSEAVANVREALDLYESR